MSIPNNNFLNLDPHEYDGYVYRVLPLERLVELIEEGKNTLVKPESWDDPFENIVLRTSFAGTEGSMSFDFHDNIFGQCWTLTRDSDALWRIYSHDKTSVRIRSTIQKLATSVLRSNPPSPATSCFVGKVEYHSQHSLETLLLNRNSLLGFVADITGRQQASSLLYKRTEFQHEQEIRLLFVDYDPITKRPRTKGALFQYPVDVNWMIDEICFDPRLSKRMVSLYRKLFENGLGFSGDICRSLLYSTDPATDA